MQRFRKCQAATAVPHTCRCRVSAQLLPYLAKTRGFKLVKKLRQHQMQQSPVACPDRALPPVHAYQGGQDPPHLQVSQWH